MIERSIEKNAEYIISYFNEKGKDITNLKLQKLLYFLEAIYMVLADEDKLFDEDFYAWDFGPVNDEIYKKYKFFINMPLSCDGPIVIPNENKRYIDELYKNFGDYKGYELVAISHQNGSPWDIINKYYNSNIPDNIKIEKKDTKEWFKSIVTINEGTDER